MVVLDYVPVVDGLDIKLEEVGAHRNGPTTMPLQLPSMSDLKVTGGRLSPSLAAPSSDSNATSCRPTSMVMLQSAHSDITNAEGVDSSIKVTSGPRSRGRYCSAYREPVARGASSRPHRPV